MGNLRKKKSTEETEWLVQAGEEYTRKYQENQGYTEWKMAEWLSRASATERERR